MYSVGRRLPLVFLVLGLFSAPVAGQLPSDFDQNGQIDAIDADLLGAAQRAGGPLDPFDVNADGMVNLDDRMRWLQMSPIPAGDADQSGQFDSSDLVKVFQSGEYADQVPLNSTWVTGDWQGDAEFNSSDLVFAYEYYFPPWEWIGLRPAQSVVPEPHSDGSALMGFLLILGSWRAGLHHRWL
jgi:hypothetical protein